MLTISRRWIGGGAVWMQHSITFITSTSVTASLLARCHESGRPFWLHSVPTRPPLWWSAVRRLPSLSRGDLLDENHGRRTTAVSTASATNDMIWYDMTILMCAQKLTNASLIYRTVPKTKTSKMKKTKKTNGYAQKKRRFSWCHCHAIMSASVKSRMVYPSGTGSPV